MDLVEWRDCKRFPDKFIISSDGEIVSNMGRSVGNAVVNGYKTACIYDETAKKIVNHYVHILVYETFNEVPTASGLYSKNELALTGHRNFYIEHIDGNKTNNKVSNLRLNDVRRPVLRNRNLPAGVQAIAKVRTGKKFENREQAYKASIQIKQSKYHLGTFDNVEDAKNAYRRAYFNYYRVYPVD